MLAILLLLAAPSQVRDPSDPLVWENMVSPATAAALDAKQVELEARTTFSPDDRVVIARLLDARGLQLNNCLNGAKLRLRRSAEPSDTLATAAMARCAGFLHNFETTFVLRCRGDGGSWPTCTDVVYKAKARTYASFHSALLAYFVEHRLPGQRSP